MGQPVPQPQQTSGYPVSEESVGDLQSQVAPGTTYTRPSSDMDLERRLKNDNESTLKIGGGKNPGDQDHLDKDGYVGVSPEYQNAANETDKPLSSNKGPEADAADAIDESLDAGSSHGKTHLTGGVPGTSSTSPQSTVQQFASQQPNPATLPGNK